MGTLRDEQHALKHKIACLEQELLDARRELSTARLRVEPNDSIHSNPALQQNRSLHTLLLLADSALPLGSFAFSSGLESCLAHNKLKGRAQWQQGQLDTFLSMSLRSLASTALPYVLASHRNPERLVGLDNEFDASTPCTVTRRASTAQGRALLSVWERSYKGQYSTLQNTDVREDSFESNPKVVEANTALLSFQATLHAPPGPLPLNAHLAPLWGVITFLLGIDLESSVYLFLFSHARTIISAAVRASVLGPYQAQTVLASPHLQHQIDVLVQEFWNKQTNKTGQSIAAIDLWAGRHEKLYSRIFNS